MQEDRPKTEAEWEAMFRQSDLKAARFGEILETVADHPDRDEIIDREMGWSLTDDEEAELREKQREEGFDPAEFANPSNEELEEAERELEREREALKKIPAYHLSMRATRLVIRVLRPYLRRSDDDEMDEDTSELIGEAFMGISTAAAKITGGHAIGYEDDAICGNIVKNKHALAGAKQSINAFEQLRALNVLKPEAVEKVLPLLIEAEAAIEARLAELRSRVWWDK